MTDREKAIVMAYTGVCMLTGDKLSVFYEYVEGIMGRPVYTHEMGTKVVDEEIKEKAKADFIALCKDERSSEKPNKWIPVSERLPNLDDFSGLRVWQKKVLITGYLSFDDTKELFVSEAFVKDVIDNNVHDTVVTAWMPLPEPYKQEAEDEN